MSNFPVGTKRRLRQRCLVSVFFVLLSLHKRTLLGRWPALSWRAAVCCRLTSFWRSRFPAIPSKRTETMKHFRFHRRRRDGWTWNRPFLSLCRCWWCPAGQLCSCRSWEVRSVPFRSTPPCGSPSCVRMLGSRTGREVECVSSLEFSLSLFVTTGLDRNDDSLFLKLDKREFDFHGEKMEKHDLLASFLFYSWSFFCFQLLLPDESDKSRNLCLVRPRSKATERHTREEGAMERCSVIGCVRRQRIMAT